MKRYTLITLSALLCLSVLSSCRKQDRILPIGEAVCHCGVDDPLNDLRWLHELALRYESLRGKQFASISICTYDSANQGFLYTECEECPDFGQAFVDCQGHTLGLVGGFAGTPLSAYNIDPASVRTIYSNYPDTVPTLTGKRWRLQRFVDRTTNPWTEEVPTGGNGPISFWLQFYEDGTLLGGGINQLQGQYYLDPEQTYRFYYTHIESVTEIYDQTGWEERLIAALNSATEYAFSDYGGRLGIYFDLNRKYLEFTLEH